MGDHSSENYLDQLLNSMHGEETEHPKEQPAAKQVLRDDFEKQLFGEEETKEKAKAKNEEDFLREFEEELLKEDIPEYTESLNQKKQEEKATQIDASLDDLLDNIPLDDFSTGDAAKEEETGFQGKSPLETAIPPDEDDFEVNTLDDAVGTFDSNLPKEEDGELDLSGLSDSDLMDMLSGDQDLSDLGDMLSSDQDGKPLEETDSIGDFARSEMNPQEEVADKIPELTEQEDIPAQAEETASNGKNKKKKKKNFFKSKLNIINLIQLEDEPEIYRIYKRKRIRKRKKRKKAASGRNFPGLFSERMMRKKSRRLTSEIHRERMSVNFRRKTSRS